VQQTYIPALSTRQLNAYELPYELPKAEAGSLPADAARMVTDVLAATGWSARTLADVIGTTHPTVRALLRGHFAAMPRNRDYQRRLKATYEIISRIFTLAGRDVGRTNTALRDQGRGPSAVDYLVQDRPNDAYLAAIRSLRPPPQDRLIIGSRPLSPQGRTTDPFDDE
jgi:hypothetical protein